MVDFYSLQEITVLNALLAVEVPITCCWRNMSTKWPSSLVRPFFLNFPPLVELRYSFLRGPP